MLFVCWNKQTKLFICPLLTVAALVFHSLIDAIVTVYTWQWMIYNCYRLYCFSSQSYWQNQQNRMYLRHWGYITYRSNCTPLIYWVHWVMFTGCRLRGSQMCVLWTRLVRYITVTAHKHHRVSHHLQLQCIFNNLFKVTMKKTPKLCIGSSESNPRACQQTRPSRNAHICPIMYMQRNRQASCKTTILLE